jgi:cobyrinic acid a,c-diamide synthase
MTPRVVIAAPHGRSGKTTVTVGLCAAFAARGLVVQPFKKGPDYIDPSWLTEASSRPCRNLDPFLMGRETIAAAFLRGSRGANLAIIEGAMGLYDGLDIDGSGSTAMLARWLDAPILLVVNAQRITRSIAAWVQGYQRFEPGTRIAGVILNNVARARHQDLMTQAIEKYCGIPVVGVLPRDESLTIPDRHLGLVPRAENDALVPAIVAAREAVLANFDLDTILKIAGEWRRGGAEASAPNPRSEIKPQKSKIGVIRDRAFTFYYPENLEALQDAGAELIFIDAMRDSRLPAVDALVIGGGFPEMFLDELQANTNLRADIRNAIENDLPVYAECGGLMYLARSITYNGRRGKMVGALPCDVEMTGKPQGHGYINAVVDGANPFFPIGAPIRGHEFHNSRVINLNSVSFAYSISRGRGIDNMCDGIVYKNVLASYTHLHALATPEWAEAIVARCRARNDVRASR